MEYVYQRLNGHPSVHWVNMKKRGLKLDGLYNTKPPQKEDIDNVRSISVRSMSHFEEEKETFEVDRNMTNSLEITQNEISKSLITDKSFYSNQVPKDPNRIPKEELIAYNVDAIPYEELGFFGKLVRIFTPFEVMYRKVWIPD